jgi:hypothetical protein
METLLPSRPESWSALIKRSLKLYSAGFVKAMPFALLMAIMVFVPRLMAIYTGNPALIAYLTDPQNLLLILVDLASIAFFIAIVWHLHCVIIDKHEPLIEDMTKGLRKVLLVFIAGIIQSALFVAAIFLALGVQILMAQQPDFWMNSSIGFFLAWVLFTAQFLLIFYVATLFIFLVPIIAIENKGILTALERSVLLVWNHWWRTITLQATPWICFFLTLTLLRALTGIPFSIYFVSQTNTDVWVIFIQMLLFAIYIPWVASLLIVQLKDLELRNRMTATA